MTPCPSNPTQRDTDNEKDFKPGSGDVGKFIVEQVTKRGGHFVSTNSLPPIGDTWRYAEDKNGVQIQMPLGQFSAIANFFHQVLGEPQLPLRVMFGGGALGGYSVRAAGVGIQFGYERDQAFVLIVRPISTTEIIRRLPAAMKE